MTVEQLMVGCALLHPPYKLDPGLRRNGNLGIYPELRHQLRLRAFDLFRFE